MKKRFAASALACLALACGPVHATSSDAPGTAAPVARDADTVLAQATPHDRLLAIAFHGDFGISVGEAGRIMTTQDGGKTWTKSPVPRCLQMKYLPYAREMVGVATNGKRTIMVGEMGHILVGGENGPWHKAVSGTTQRLLNVSINDNGLAFAVGAFGTLLKSTDGGESWTSVAPDWVPLYNPAGSDSFIQITNPTLYAVKVSDDGSVLIGGENGQILRSPDQGATWDVAWRYPVASGEVAPTVFGMQIGPGGTGYAVGQADLMLKTTDGGSTWTPLKSSADGQSEFFAVDSDAQGNVLVVGMRAAFRSTDGGATWKRMDGLDLAMAWYSDVSHASSDPPGTFIAVGNRARIIQLAE